VDRRLRQRLHPLALKISEQAVFRWVVIVMVAAISIIALTLLTRPLFGALWGLILVIAASVYGYRRGRESWRRAGTK
jgi:uncharacterized membrane protein YdjX (TVP38/TMEM64 family)